MSVQRGRSLLAMDLNIIETKAEFDNVLAHKHHVAKNHLNYLNQNRSFQTQKENQQQGHQRDLEKIIPRWGCVPKDFIQTHKKRSNQIQDRIQNHGYHRTIYPCKPMDVQKSFQNIDEQFLKRLHKEISSNVEKEPLKTLVTQKIPKIMTNLNEKQLYNKNIVQVLLEQLFKNPVDSNKKIGSLKENLNGKLKSNIKTILQMIYKNWELYSLQAQGSLDRTVNYRNQSWDQWPNYQKPFKSRKINKYAFQQKLIENIENTYKQKKSKRIQLQELTRKQLIEEHAKILKQNQEQKQKSKQYFKKIIFLADRFKLTVPQAEEILISKMSLNKGKIHAQFKSLQQIKLIQTLQVQQAIQIIPKIRQQQVSDKKFANKIKIPKQNASNKLIKTNRKWLKKYQNSQNSTKVEIYEDSEEQTQSKSDLKYKNIKDKKTPQIKDYKKLRSAMENFWSSLRAEQNIFHYVVKKPQNKRKSSQQDKNRSSFLQNSQDNQQNNQCLKQENENSAQTCYEEK